MKKKLFSLLLVLVLCVGVIPLTANAAGTAWDGRTSEPFAGGDGSEDNPYQIANGAQLYYLTLQESTDYYYELTSDIDLNNKLFPMIMTFDGTLDGKQHKISGIRIDISESNTDSAVGLIVSCSGTVKNLTIYGDIKSTLYYTGGIAGKLTSNGKILNCTNYCNIEQQHVKSQVYTGTGGIIGFGQNTIEISNCKNFGTIRGTCVGGIAGKINLNNNQLQTPKITSCLNTGSIYADVGNKFNTRYAGGICGDADGGYISQ